MSTRATGEPTKTQAIRDELTKAARPLAMHELQPRLERRLKQIIGKEKLYTLLSIMINGGELDSVGRGRTRFYWFKKEITL